MTKLSDTQRILLSTAAQRPSGSLWPLPSTLHRGGGTAKAVAALVRNGLAEERETSDADEVSRSDGDVRYGVFIAVAGTSAIGIEPEVASESGGGVMPDGDAMRTARPSSKAAAVIALLQRADGATLPELIEATGWLPHTTRAALTGLRKKGHAITRGQRDGATCYSIEARV